VCTGISCSADAVEASSYQGLRTWRASLMSRCLHETVSRTTERREQFMSVHLFTRAGLQATQICEHWPSLLDPVIVPSQSTSGHDTHRHVTLQTAGTGWAYPAQPEAHGIKQIAVRGSEKAQCIPNKKAATKSGFTPTGGSVGEVSLGHGHANTDEGRCTPDAVSNCHCKLAGSTIASISAASLPARCCSCWQLGLQGIQILQWKQRGCTQEQTRRQHTTFLAMLYNGSERSSSSAQHRWGSLTCLCHR
jgi:hypothetical protein